MSAPWADLPTDFSATFYRAVKSAVIGAAEARGDAGRRSRGRAVGFKERATLCRVRSKKKNLDTNIPSKGVYLLHSSSNVILYNGSQKQILTNDYSLLYY